MTRKVINTNRLNEVTEVVCHDEPGQGGMCHKYSVVQKEVDPDKGGQKECAYVNFQNGPIKESGVNGCHHEDLLMIVLDRLRGAQKGDFACRENALAITHLETALLWLNYRTNTRVHEKVEGENKHHESNQ